MMQRPQRILCLVDNLFFGARIDDAARRMGITCEFARNAEDFRRLARDHPPGLILVDMASQVLPWEELVREVRDNPASASVPVLAFGRHTESELFKLARRSGVDRAVTNAQLSEKLPDLLREFLGSAGRSP